MKAALAAVVPVFTVKPSRLQQAFADLLLGNLNVLHSRLLEEGLYRGLYRV